MRSGVSFPSFATTATWAVVAGAVDANYPVANLADLLRLRRVTKSTGTTLSVTFTLPAAQSLQFIGMLHHNALAAETIRIRLFSDANPDPVGNAGAIVHDSTAMPVFPVGAAPSARYAQCRPYVLPAAVTARSGRIDLSAHATVWSIGAFEIGGFWEWADVHVSRAFGVRNRDVTFEQPLDVDHTVGQWAPRVVQGSREVILQSEAYTTGLDFSREKMKNRPFVWVWDYADPTTWDREVIAVTNTTLPTTRSLHYLAARFAFDFGEHLR